MDLPKWKAELAEDVRWIASRRAEPPRRGLTSQQCAAAACGFMCCAPCALWSVVWRVACLPAKCFDNGRGACAPNDCTECTDTAVRMGACEVVPARHPHLLAAWTRDEDARREIAAALLDALRTYAGNDARVYALVWRRCAAEMDRLGATVADLRRATAAA